jgi:hypothetical protein
VPDVLPEGPSCRSFWGYVAPGTAPFKGQLLAASYYTKYSAGTKQSISHAISQKVIYIYIASESSKSCKKTTVA